MRNVVAEVLVTDEQGPAPVAITECCGGGRLAATARSPGPPSLAAYHCSSPVNHGTRRVGMSGITIEGTDTARWSDPAANRLARASALGGTGTAQQAGLGSTRTVDLRALQTGAAVHA